MTDESASREHLVTADTHGGRTHTCGELRPHHEGETAVLKGWVDTRRNLGGLLFMDLRDRYGLTQLVFPEELHERAAELKSEDVISVRGGVVERQQKNSEMPTGDVEIQVEDLAVLNVSETPPFIVSAREERQREAGEDLRLKYRYLDLRRPELQRNLQLRHAVYQITRKYFSEHDFTEIETPVLMKSTPEGARDFLVPSRLHPGKFYALPQSPQTYKQICMVAGLDRYMQIVKCFRDEDLRADRQPEFTQVDIEMSFASQETVFELMEGHMAALWKEIRGKEIELPFPRMTYDEAIRTYGTDKPDTRFGMEIEDVSDVFNGSGVNFLQGILDDGGAITALRVDGEGDRGRSAMDRLEDEVKKQGAGGLGYIKLGESGEADSWLNPSILDPKYVDQVCEQVEAAPGDLVLVIAGPEPDVFAWTGHLRLHLGKQLDLIPPRGEGEDEFLWVTDFPLLEWSEEEQRHTAMHHPFTAPLAEDMEKLEDAPEKARAKAYDLVLNGTEIGGGSMRIYNRKIQKRMFEILGIDDETAERRFGFLLEAFRFGAPPHGGIALGLDRLVMLLAGADSLREVIAFPKTQSAQEPMVGSPDVVDAAQLEDLHLQVAVVE